MVPRTVLTRPGPISLNAARPVNIVQPRTVMNNAGPMKNVINNAYSTARRPFNKITAANNINFNKRVNTVNDKNINTVRPNAVVNTARPKAVLSAVMRNKENVVKASTCWVWRPKYKVIDHHKGVIDSGCSRHMTGNRSYLTDYEEINGGFVAFGGNSKGGKITGKDFKLTDENHVLLKVPRKDNMYSVDLKNVIPQRGLTCLFAKATPDESNLWHRRLGHVNFKTLNKLVKGNLVRGRKPALSFMRPFGCPVTILNTIDHLGKFNGKADEGFFVGYSTNSKAFRKDIKDPRNESGNLTEWKDSEAPSTKEPRINQEKDDNINSTNNINTASDGNSINNVNAVSSTVNTIGSEVNVVDPKTSI
ncbi:ribonuclease H-like domain-containing protein [Tanacetum coccineum]|uniref:Ribonuclease H-like domain-containing protein n=1 Tax=Tanacetum coccineum TaxID=301880 RepID=A0ABQ5D5A5_9ASTR